MAVTEKQAARMWCPMARVHTGTQHSVSAANRNLLERDGGLSNCFGPLCMAWRWSNNHRIVGFCGAFGDPRASLPTVVMEDEP